MNGVIILLAGFFVTFGMWMWMIMNDPSYSSEDAESRMGLIMWGVVLSFAWPIFIIPTFFTFVGMVIGKKMMRGK